jgi:hypothetical protein
MLLSMYCFNVSGLTRVCVSSCDLRCLCTP